MHRFLSKRPTVTLKAIRPLIHEWDNTHYYKGDQFIGCSKSKCAEKECVNELESSLIVNPTMWIERFVPCGINEIDHVVPRKILDKYSAPYGDGHNLMSVCQEINRFKGSNVVGSFIPSHAGKGPLARAVLYTYWAWIGLSPPHFQLLQKWNQMYPPSSIEIQRELAIYARQRTSNPFIRHYTEFSNFDF